MSYDIQIKNKAGETVRFPSAHDIAGGTYAVGGTDEAWLNVTYNYAPIFYRVLGEKGVRTIYGLSPRDSIPVLDAALEKLGDATPDRDYWKPSHGNAKRALENLRRLAQLAVEHFPDEALAWDGD